MAWRASFKAHIDTRMVDEFTTFALHAPVSFHATAIMPGRSTPCFGLGLRSRFRDSPHQTGRCCWFVVLLLSSESPSMTADLGCDSVLAVSSGCAGGALSCIGGTVFFFKTQPLKARACLSLV